MAMTANRMLAWSLTRSYLFVVPIVLAALIITATTGLGERIAAGFRTLYRDADWRGDVLAALMGSCIILFLTFVTGCSSPVSAPPTPREQVMTIGNAYAALLSATDAALSTSQVPATAQGEIRTTARAVTDSYHVLNAEALKCQRKEDGTVADATDYAIPPGEHCNPSTVTRLLLSLKGAIGDADLVLASYGFAPAVRP